MNNATYGSSLRLWCIALACALRRTHGLLERR